MGKRKIKFGLSLLGIFSLFVSAVFCFGHANTKHNTHEKQEGYRKEKKPAYMNRYNLIYKRVLDIGVGSFFVLISSPVFIVVTLLIILDDGLPVFYRANRGGFKEKDFKILKFRTMVKNADKIGGGTTALNDPRITKVGAFLRKTKLDEIPQFLQVVTGKMSIIGPRPELTRYTEKYEGEEKIILQVRPGITDFSSIEFINLDEIVGDENADEMYEKNVLGKKNKLRIKYANTVSLKTDAYIFFMTMLKVIEKAARVVFKIKR